MTTFQKISHHRGYWQRVAECAWQDLMRWLWTPDSTACVRSSRARRQRAYRRSFVEALEPRMVLDGGPVISEFVALNTNGLADENGDRSDWIEIHNPTPTAIDLTGWYLTDDANALTKWQFPAETLPAGGFMVVFASNKDRAVAGSELHTNFALSGDGEYLALVEPDGVSVASAYAPTFPPQFSDVSYGPTFGQQQATTTLNAVSDIWVRQSVPGTVYENDGMFVSTVHDGGQQRLGIAQFDLSDLATPINSAWLQLYTLDGANISLAPAAWVDSTVQAGPVSTLSYAQYASSIQPFQTNLEQLGSGPFTSAAPVAGSYGATLSATPADRDVLNTIRTGDGIVTFIFKAASGSRYFSANDAYSGFKPAQLVLDIGSPPVLQPNDLRYFTASSPGGPNYGGALGVVADTQFTIDRGFFDAPFDTVVSSDTPGATLVYTTNGSTPTLTNGTIVPAPNASTPPSASVHIAGTTTLRAAAFMEGFVPANTDTETYLFVADIVAQSPTGQAPPGWPSSSINGQIFNYGMDPDIVNNTTVTGDFNADMQIDLDDYAILKNHWGQSVVSGTQGDMNGDALVNLNDFTLFKQLYQGGPSEGGWGLQLEDALKAIATVSLVTDLSNLINPATGIYVNASQSGAAWERPMSIELINPDGSPGFQIDGGMRIRGNFSASGSNPKHAFRLFFDGGYEGALEFPVFGDGASSFEKLDLRTDQNDSWAFLGSDQDTFTHDPFAHDTLRDMDELGVRTKNVHLYINGVYWGIFQFQERPSKEYGEAYFGGDSDDYDVVKSSGGQGGYTTEATDGTLDAWFELWSAARAGVTDNADYYRLQGLDADGVTRNLAYPVLLDVDNLINYMSVIFYTGNEDGPLVLPLNNNRSNNWFGIYNRNGGEGFQFFTFDAEQTMLSHYNEGGLYADRTGPFTGSNQNNFLYSNPQWLHQDLMANAEYRQRFADLTHKHFFNGGALTTEAAQQRFLDRAAEVSVAIIAESARWGDAHPSRTTNPLTKTDWQNAVDNIVDNYFPLRGTIVLNQLKGDGLYPNTIAPQFNQHGGTISPGFNLTISAPLGTIYYTLDGADPRQIGGGVKPGALMYGGPIGLLQPTTVNARVLNGGQWSALTSADFQVNIPRLRITELMYHPPQPPGGSPYVEDDFEFLELQNIGSTTIQLAGIQVADGISFTFPSMTLAPNAYVVVAENTAAFASMYGGGIAVAGQYSGKLSNSGELLTLRDAVGQTIQSFIYADSWYPITDGDGYSMVIVDVNEDVTAWNSPSNWRPSENPGGSPGAADPPAATEGGAAQEAVDETSRRAEALTPPAPEQRTIADDVSVTPTSINDVAFVQQATPVTSARVADPSAYLRRLGGVLAALRQNVASASATDLFVGWPHAAWADVRWDSESRTSPESPRALRKIQTLDTVFREDGQKDNKSLAECLLDHVVSHHHGSLRHDAAYRDGPRAPLMNWLIDVHEDDLDES